MCVWPLQSQCWDFLFLHHPHGYQLICNWNPVQTKQPGSFFVRKMSENTEESQQKERKRTLKECVIILSETEFHHWFYFSLEHSVCSAPLKSLLDFQHWQSPLDFFKRTRRRMHKFSDKCAHVLCCSINSKIPLKLLVSCGSFKPLSVYFGILPRFENVPA